MRKFIQMILIVFLLPALGGCGLIPFHLEHPTKSKETIKNDHLSCYRDALAHYPIRKGIVDGRWIEAKGAQTDCTTRGNDTTCYHTPESAGYRDRVNGDVNEGYRNHEYKECMTKKDAQYKCVHPAFGEKGLHYCAEEGAGSN